MSNSQNDKSSLKSRLESVMIGINVAIKEIRLSQQELDLLVSIHKKCQQMLLVEINKPKQVNKPQTIKKPAAKTKCSICGVKVNKNNLKKHKAKMHGKRKSKNKKGLPDWDKEQSRNDIFNTRRVVSGGGFGVGRGKK